MTVPVGPVARLLQGMRYPLRGAALLARTPAFWPWAIAPVLLTGGGLVTAVWLVIRYTPAMLGWLWPLPPGAGALLVALWWIVELILTVSLASVAVLAAWLLSGLVAVPFLDQLSQRVETAVTGRPPEDGGWRQLLGDLALSLLHTALGLLLWAAIMVTLLIVGLIPVLGPPVQALGSLIASAGMVCREMMDGSMSRRRMGFGHKLRTVTANRTTALGYGLVVLFMLWIPLMNLLMLPIAVTAGTLLFLDLERDGRVPEP